MVSPWVTADWAFEGRIAAVHEGCLHGPIWIM